MKEKLTDELKEIFVQSRKWLKLEIRYVKLTAAEKCTVLMSAIFLSLISLLIGMVILILLAFSLADYFQNFMSPALSCLSVSGVLVCIIVIIFLLRKPLIVNPIARLLSRLIIDKE